MLLSVRTVTHGRFSVTTETVLEITETTLLYGRYEIDLDTIEMVSANPTERSVSLKFSYKSRPKVFFLENASACAAVVSLLQDLCELPEGEDRPGRTRRASHEEPLYEDGGGGVFDRRAPLRNDAGSYSYADGEDAGVTAPTWVHSLLGVFGGCTEMIDYLYGRLLSGDCCRHYPCEALIFGVCMPLALAGDWLRDTTGIYEETAHPFSGENEEGSEQWLEASCELGALELDAQMVYHHGKFMDARNKQNQEGTQWRLEPVWNVTVTLLDPLPASWRRKGWADRWMAVAHTYVIDSDRPYCTGEVLESLIEARRDCNDLKWIPQRFRGIADLEHALSAPNEIDSGFGFTQCWVARTDQRSVFLDVSEPLSLYGDVFAVLLCMCISLTFAVCFARVHRESILEAVHKMRGTVPADPAIIDGPRGGKSRASVKTGLLALGTGPVGREGRMTERDVGLI